MQYINVANQGVKSLSPYQAGKPIEELERELGITDIVKLASNENPFGFPESAKKAIQAQLDHLTRYPDANGFELKAAIAKKFGVQPNQITLGNGSNDLLELFAHTFAGEHDEVIYSQYAFIVYPLVTKAINATAREIPTKNWGHDLDGFLAAINDKTKLIFIANPNNPTGNFLTHTELDAFLAQVPSHIIVVLDEAYTEFTAPTERVDSFALLAKYSNLIISRSLSKAYGLAGLRIGYAVSNAEIAEMYGKTFAVDTNQMVVVKDITCFSHCEHHMALMYDMSISIGYIPKGRVIGLSKIPRIAEMCCKRLQLQEKIGEDIAEVISLATGSNDVIVHIISSHSCMSARGIKSTDSQTTTLTTKGVFNEDHMIHRFMLMKQS